MHPSVQCSNAYNTQDMEASVTGEQKKMWHMYPAECYSAKREQQRYHWEPYGWTQT